MLLIVVALCLVGILLVSRMVVRPAPADKKEMPPVSNVLEPVPADKKEMLPESKVLEPAPADKKEMSPGSKVLESAPADKKEMLPVSKVSEPALTSKAIIPPEVSHALKDLLEAGKAGRVEEVLRELVEVNCLITKSRTYAQVGEGTIGNLCLLVSFINAMALALGHGLLDQDVVVEKCALAKMQYFEKEMQKMLELNWLLPYEAAIVDQTAWLKLAIRMALSSMGLPVLNFKISVINASGELGGDFWKDDVEIIMTKPSDIFVKFKLLYIPGHFDLVGVPILEDPSCI